MNQLRSTTHRIGPALVLAFILTAILPVVALAHPLGNFTTNRYSRLTLAQDEVRLFYVVDMAEIPAFKSITAADVDKNGDLDDAEQARYLEAETPRLIDGLVLSVEGRPLELRLRTATLTLPPGQGGLRTLRLEMALTAALPAGERTALHYHDQNGRGQLGWREIVVQSAEGVTLMDSSVPSQDLSDALRRYPEGLLQTPPAITEANVVFAASGAGAETSTMASSLYKAVSSVERSTTTDPFADLISVPLEGPLALTLALLAAFMWGGAHALSPGHGKSIVAAYLVGSRGTIKHALFLGLTTTVTHTAGVFALGVVTLFASRYFMPAQLFPWLSVASGLLVVGIGLSLCWGRLRPLLARQAHHHFHEHHHHHDHDRNHHHDHAHEHDHHGHHTHSPGGHGHSHLPPGTDGIPVTWRSLLALGISGGLLPCPSALVVMLGAIALGRVAFGLFLILVFSLGLASVLTLIGVLMVHAGKLIKYVPEGGRLLRLVPIGSALFITLAGVGITLQALWQIGSLSL